MRGRTARTATQTDNRAPGPCKQTISTTGTTRPREPGQLAEDAAGASAADRAATPRLPLGPGADGADDRPAHGRGGLRGGGRGAPGDRAKLSDELGDLLFQVYFLALLLEEEGDGRSRRRWRAASTRSLCPPSPRLRRRRGAHGRPRPRELGGGSRPSRKGREGIFHDVPETLPGAPPTRESFSVAPPRSGSSTRTRPTRWPISTTSWGSSRRRSRSPAKAHPRPSRPRTCSRSWRCALRRGQRRAAR